MLKYNSFLTTCYKRGFIHSYNAGGYEVFQVQVDAYAYIVQVKSTHAAKILITKHSNKIRGVSK